MRGRPRVGCRGGAARGVESADQATGSNLPKGPGQVIRPATAADTPAVNGLIRALAEYERLTQTLTLDEGRLRQHLFGPRPFAEVVVAEEGGAVVGYAMFFPTYS